MIGIDVIGAHPRALVGFDWASLASGVLKTAGGVAEGFAGGDKKPDVTAQFQEAKLAKQKAEDEAQRAKESLATYKTILIGGGIAILVAVMGGIVVIGKRKS